MKRKKKSKHNKIFFIWLVCKMWGKKWKGAKQIHKHTHNDISTKKGDEIFFHLVHKNTVYSLLNSWSFLLGYTHRHRHQVFHIRFWKETTKEPKLKSKSKVGVTIMIPILIPAKYISEWCFSVFRWYGTW